MIRAEPGGVVEVIQEPSASFDHLIAPEVSADTSTTLWRRFRIGGGISATLARRKVMTRSRARGVRDDDESRADEFQVDEFQADES